VEIFVGVMINRREKKKVSYLFKNNKRIRRM